MFQVIDNVHDVTPPAKKDDTLWLFNIAMENGPFIDDCPIKTSNKCKLYQIVIPVSVYCVYIYVSVQYMCIYIY